MEKLQYLLTVRLAKLDTDLADLDPYSSDLEPAIQPTINDTLRSIAITINSIIWNLRYHHGILQGVRCQSKVDLV
mgnify:CR=1 FL=1